MLTQMDAPVQFSWEKLPKEASSNQTTTHSILWVIDFLLNNPQGKCNNFAPDKKKKKKELQ